MTPTTRRCDEATRRGRLRKAEQFINAAETIREFADDQGEITDSYVTLCVHAGIAAADAVCCARMGLHATGEDHGAAIALINRVRPDGGALAQSLHTLLAMKTRAGYSAWPMSETSRKQAARHAERLVNAARAR